MNLEQGASHDRNAILPAFQGQDAVIYPAAEPRHSPDIGRDLLMPGNVVATANVFESALPHQDRL